MSRYIENDSHIISIRPVSAQIEHIETRNYWEKGFYERFFKSQHYMEDSFISSSLKRLPHASFSLKSACETYS